MKTFRKISVFAIFFAAALALSFSFAPPAKAQITTGVFSGTVTDPTGAVVPQAEVKITNIGTNVSTPTKTDSNGFYRVSELPVSQYRIEVTAKGFKTSVRNYVILNAGAIEHVDFALELGEAKQVVTVEAGAAPLVQTEDYKLYETIGGGQVANLPLNGRNVFDLISLAPGAVNVTGVDFENGHNTVINGLRPDFIGFLVNGVSNKGLSGGVVTVPNADIVQEFQELTLNMSAQYGNSAAGIVNVVTKSGTNAFHGDVYEFLRNDKLDANDFFNNQAGIKRSPLRFNQFGVTAQGPVIKDHLFFSGSYQGDRFLTNALPIPIQTETPEWRAAIQGLFPNSVGALLYKNFPATAPGVRNITTLTDYVTNNNGGSGTGFPSFAAYLCPDNTSPALAATFQSMFGVNPGTGPGQDDFSKAVADANGNYTQPCSVTPAAQAGAISRSIPFLQSNALVFPSQTLGNLFDGNEWSTRLDWIRKNDSIFGEFYWQRTHDKFGLPNASSGIHGFKNPLGGYFPNFQLSYVHTFNPHLLSESRFGYVRNRSDVDVAIPGVPSIGFDDGSAGFGSYNGYPQFFHENIYTYSEMVTITKGRHNIKAGADFRRNLENSIFNVARPSYYFFDQIFFAVDAPYGMVAGVDPGFVTNRPSQLASNDRGWRNLEFGGYFQDDWKVTKNLTLSLGLRYDLYTRHVDVNHRQTTFIPGPGGIIPGNGFFLDGILNANVPAGSPGCDTPAQIARDILAGVCGPGGFAEATSLGRGNHKNIGPRVGVAWDPFGKGTTSIRGGFGISYEGTLYNPLSNSRWNPPFYSFNRIFNFLGSGGANVIYGPTVCPAPGTCMPSGATPTFTGPPSNPGQGVGAQAVGNLTGWDSASPNLAFLTGIVFPDGIRDPRIYNSFLSVQHEILPQTVLEVTYVGTQGDKLFRAEQGNRFPGIALGPGEVVNVQGRTLIGLGRRFLNPNYGRLRIWDNVSKSWYNALQVSARRQMAHGFLFSANYAWSHSIDTGSTWHSGATTANGSGAGEGFSLDVTRPGLDRGNSIFDIRQRLSVNYVWELPWLKAQHGFAGHVLGGWQYNGIWAFQTGAHWEPSCNIGSRCDFNKDGERNDRPDAIHGNFFNASRSMWANGWFFPGSPLVKAGFTGPLFNTANPFFGVPCRGCDGNLGRNTLVGPGIFSTDESLFKNILITERFKAQFRAEFFNAFNHANFTLPNSATGGNGATHLTSGIFGKSAGTLGPRQIQFGLKFLW